MIFVAMRATYQEGGKKPIQEEILKSLLRGFCKCVRICVSWCFCGMGDVPAVLGRKHVSQL